MKPGFRRPLRALAIIAMVGATALVLAAIAAALPGDPPIKAISPADRASLPASDSGIEVSFGCPAYRKEEDEEGEVEKGEADDYGVRFSTSRKLEADGRLSTSGFGDDGEAFADLKPDKTTCSAELELPSAPVPQALYQGTVYWQAYRACDGCASGFETGPVSSFAVIPNLEEPELVFEDHVYAGYLTKVSFTTFSEITGATVALQRWDGSSWGTVAEGPADKRGETDFLVKLDPGHHAYRVLITAGQTAVATEPLVKFARKEGSRRSVGSADDGRYLAASRDQRHTEPVRLEVTDDGREVERLRASVDAVCAGPTPAQSIHVGFVAAVRRARIAPDGRVIGRAVARDGAVVELAGDLHDKRFSGEVSTSYGPCSGSREIEAVLVHSRS